VNKFAKIILNDSWFYALVIFLLFIIAGKFHFDSVDLYIENKKYREVIKIQSDALRAQNARIIQSQKDIEELIRMIDRYNKLIAPPRGSEA
jgi:hypothetical protein|tara:strand:+ start:406 stop:678 length:273 start_codon:yes stop_codon:yes gene_type:complete